MVHLFLRKGEKNDPLDYWLIDWLFDLLIDWIVFYAVFAIFQPYNGERERERDKERERERERERKREKSLYHFSIIQHKAYFLIQLNADSLYPFACWSLCLLILIILIESRSMLIVYWLGDRKLINAYLTKKSIQNINFPKEFLKIYIMYCKNTSMCLYIFLYLNIILNNNVLKRKSAYRYANWAMLWMLMRYIHEC